VRALPPEVLTRTAHAVLVAPSLALKHALRKVAALAAADFQEDQPETAARIRQLVSASSGLFDAAMIEAAQLTLSDPALFTHYWQDSVAMARFFEVWAEPGASLDFDCLLSVLGDLHSSWRDDLAHAPHFHAPATVVLGGEDPVIDAAESLKLARTIFPTAEATTISHTGHFPHLERPELFLDLLRKGATVR